MTTARPPRGAWDELRAYRASCAAFEETLARHPGDWYACAYGKQTAISLALHERDVQYQRAVIWAASLRWRVDEHAEQETEQFTLNEQEQDNGVG
jgi:hypothetical protein